MDPIRTTYDQHAFVFWAALLVLVLLVGLWVLVEQMRTRRLEARIDAIFADVSDGNTAQLLVEYLGLVRNTATTVGKIKEEHDRVAAVMPSVIRHVGLVRFSPFHDTGGDQSFALAVLDGQGDGVVITALHSRTDSRLYAKPIEQGRSTYTLTPEENEAIDRALRRAPVAVQG